MHKQQIILIYVLLPDSHRLLFDAGEKLAYILSLTDNTFFYLVKVVPTMIIVNATRKSKTFLYLNNFLSTLYHNFFKTMV